MHICHVDVVSRALSFYQSSYHTCIAYQTSICLDPHQKYGWGWYRQTCLSSPVLTVPRRCFFVICFSCHTVLSIPCSLVVTCWERTYISALLYVMFSSVFVTFPYGVLGRGWCLIVWIPDLCISYFVVLGLELAIDPPTPPGGILYTMIFWNYII